MTFVFLCVFLRVCGVGTHDDPETFVVVASGREKNIKRSDFRRHVMMTMRSQARKERRWVLNSCV